MISTARRTARRVANHETITVADVRLTAEFFTGIPLGTALATRIDLLLASPLAAPQVLSTFWTPDLLLSSRTRAEWVEPNRAPLMLRLIVDWD